MSRTWRFLTSAFFTYVYQAALLVTGLWMAPFLLHRLGQHDYGVWLVGFQILSYLILLDFGVIAVVPREVAHLTGRARALGTTPEISSLVADTARVVLYQIPVVLLAAAAIWMLVPASWQVYRGVLGLILIAFVVAFPLRIFAALLEGLQDFAYIGGMNLCALALGTTVTVVSVLKGYGLYALPLNWATMQGVIIAASMYRITRRFPETLPRRLPPIARSTLFRFLSRGFWVSLNQVAQPMLSSSDMMVVGKLGGATAVVPYNATGKLIGVLGNQPQVLMLSAIPGLSELKTGATREHTYRVTTALSLAVLLLCGAIVAVVLAVNQGFVSRWLGPAQYSGITLTALVGTALLLRQWNLINQFSTFCFGHERRITITVFVDGLVTCAASIFFVWFLGPVGGPLGSILGVCLISLPLNLKALGQETGASRAALVKPLWPWFWRFIALVTCILLVTRILRPTTIAEIALTAAAVLIVYCLFMWPVAMRSSLGVYLNRMLAAIRMRTFAKAVPVA